VLSVPLHGLERPEEGELVVAPEIAGPGAWSGAPSVVMVGDSLFYLAYRVRMPLGQGRGVSNVIARSSDGVHFEPVTVLRKDRFGAESLERPALVRTEDGRWRLFVSCAIPGSKRWRIVVVEAAEPEDLGDPDRSSVRAVLAEYADRAVKDPVVVHAGGTWHMWVCVHPLDDPGATDRMRTDYGTSTDGLNWTLLRTALAPRHGQWDSRGARITAVVLGADGRPTAAYYDGRSTAEENWEERVGFAVPMVGEPGAFVALGARPIGQSPYGAQGLRYLNVIARPDGTSRLYYEMTRADGAHELRTCVQTAASAF